MKQATAMACADATDWVEVCALDDLTPWDGNCALVKGRQVAIFRVDEGVDLYAIDNYDPIGKANVLSRGIVGDISGELVVASPLYKQHFSLKTGRCLEKEEVRVPTYAVRVVAGRLQIAVFPEANGLDESRMQLLARELNLPGTVFVLPPADDTHFRRLRIFLPTGEIDFGGHAIIAAAHVLAATGSISLKRKHTPIVLRLNGGPLQVYITEEGGTPVFVQFTQRTRSQIDRFVPSYGELAEILSLPETDLEKLKYAPLMVSCGYPYLIVPLRSYEAVRKACFHHNAWGQSSAPSTFAQEILLFSTQSPETTCDFHGRLVGPRIGVHDDPPIGSSLPAFAHYLCAQPPIKRGTHTFTIDRGQTATRQSILSVEMDNKQAADLTIRVGGPAILMSEGQIRA